VAEATTSIGTKRPRSREGGLFHVCLPGEREALKEKMSDSPQ